MTNNCCKMGSRSNNVAPDKQTKEILIIIKLISFRWSILKHPCLGRSTKSLNNQVQIIITVKYKYLKLPCSKVTLRQARVLNILLYYT